MRARDLGRVFEPPAAGEIDAAMATGESAPIPCAEVNLGSAVGANLVTGSTNGRRNKRSRRPAVERRAVIVVDGAVPLITGNFRLSITAL